MKKILITFLTVLILFMSHLVSAAENAKTQPFQPTKNLVLMIDRLDVSDLNPQETPNIWKLMEKGAVGLLNSPSAGARITSNTCCTISAGQRVLSSANAPYNFEAGEYVNGEKASDVFTRNTGIKPSSDHLLVSSIEAIKRNNIEKNLNIPGILGDEIHQMGFRTAVIGNSDLPGSYSRNGVLMLMDSRGIVDTGKVGREVTDYSASVPGRSNYREILRQSLNTDAEVVLVEFGDLSRLDSLSNLFAPQSLSKQRKDALHQIDACIGELIKQKASQEPYNIYIISPSSSKTATANGDLLTPIIIVKPEMKGVLTGISTRREGIVSSLVIKDSILASLSPNMKESITSSSHPHPYSYISESNRELVFSYVNQKWFMTLICSIIIILLAVAFIMHYKKARQNMIDYILIWITSVPLTLLLIANLGVLTPVYLVLVFLAFNILISGLSYAFSRWNGINPQLPTLLGTIICIGLDLFLHLGMLEKSMMSYRIMAGSRYYGLGNEYMGVLLAAGIVFSAIFLQARDSARRRIGIALLFAAIIFINASPQLGTKVGGTITAALALGYTYMHLSNQRLDPKKTISLVLGTIGVLLVMAIIDLRQPLELQSHMARNVSLIMTGGLQEALIIIQRKMQMQWKVINFTIWAWVLFFSVLVAGYRVFNPGTVLFRLKIKYPYVYAGLKGLIIAAIIAIAFNDSGITAAASLFIYAMVMILHYKKMEPNE